MEVGIIGAAFELTRPADGWYGVGATASDTREWVQAALFREAMKLADSDDPSDIHKPLYRCASSSGVIPALNVILVVVVASGERRRLGRRRLTRFRMSPEG